MTAEPPGGWDAYEVELAEDLFGGSAAVFSAGRTYRYQLTRTWDPALGPAVWIMLNPSTADAFRNDPTVKRCVDFTIAWGLGSLTVVNLFALRSTDPKALDGHADPVGPANDWFIAEALTSAAVVIAAWGAKDLAASRGAEVLARAGCEVHCLSLLKDGQPGHPLYIPGAAKPIPYAPIGA